MTSLSEIYIQATATDPAIRAPKPLRREFEATHPGAFAWDYLGKGPDQWQVRIGRVDADA